MATPLSPSSLAFQRAHIHEDRRGGIVAVNVVALIITYTAVSLRWISRRLAGTKFEADDWWICVAAVSITGFVAGLSSMVHYGTGRHTVLVVNPKALVISTTVTGMFYNTSNLSVKISILFLYRRIFPTRWLKFTLLALGLFTLAQWITFNLVVILQCVPVSAQWTPGLSAKRVNFSIATLVSGILNVVTDILILASPMHTVWRLKASKARKRLITVTFLLGGIVCIISIVRMAYVLSWGGEDPAYDNVPTTETSAMEISVGALAACLPIYRPLYNHLIQKTVATNTSAKDSRLYGQLPEGQSSIRMEPIGSTWTSHATPPRSDEDEALYARFGGSSVAQVEGGVKSTQSARGNDITVTRQFTTTISARD